MSLATLPKVSDPFATATWVDSSSVMMRGDVPIATMQFYYFTLDAAIEVCRLQTSTSHIRAMIDLLTKVIDYYPAKPGEESSESEELAVP